MSSVDLSSLDTASSASDFQGFSGGVGLSDARLNYGRRKMLDLVNRLHNTGVQVDLDLPMIAVIGSQSAGKSSLIESISDITLPRAAGTCTRCPTECRLAFSTDPWKCRVSLRFLKDSRGQALPQARVVPFGEPIYQKSAVEDRIARAQRAILNPSTDPHHFLEDDVNEPSHRELTFSENCVSLEITGPNVADLSFCDLPGLIASVGTGGNANDIALVESLIRNYIRKDSCIILLTVTCETDFENQGAHRCAKENDPNGERTIGVLTKPDRAAAGDEDRWLRMIRNELEPLLNHWYCVKQPDSKALKRGILWEEARREEDEFFRSTPPWNNLDSVYQTQLRTNNLTERLSGILSDLISQRLPQIQEELQTSLSDTIKLFEELPKPPSSDPLSEILGVLHTFIRDLEQHLHGTPDSNGLIQSIRPAQLRFKTAVQSCAPDFRPYPRSNASAGKEVMPKIDFLLDDEGEEASEKAVERVGTSPSGSKKAISTILYIDEVLKRATDARTRELPGNHPFTVYSALISESINRWASPAERLVEEVYSTVKVYMKTLVSQHFSSFRRGDLQKRVLFVLSNHLATCYERTKESVRWLVSLEEKPDTLNEHYYADYRDKFLAYYRGCRQRTQNKAFVDSVTSPWQNTNVSTVLSSLAILGVTVPRGDLIKLLPVDQMEPALVIMASVRAYFQVAYKRFTDYVVLAIDRELIWGLKDGLEVALHTGLGITGSDAHRICGELVQESAVVSSRREELTRKLNRLNEAKQELFQVM